MKVLDLFSGIGGFSLAARWVEWETVQFVEWDSFCQKVLKHHWPCVPIHGDIRTFNGQFLHGTVDIICGGFPCQPYSLAGKRKGKEDERHLWPEMLRTIRDVKPTWVVGENVFGLVNWSGGLVFNEVQADLENEGYKVQSYILPACAVNAPHRRDRVWIVAHSQGAGNNRIGRLYDNQREGNTEENRDGFWDKSHHDGKIRLTPDTTGNAVTGQDREGFEIERKGIAINEQVGRGQFTSIQPERLDDLSRDVADTNLPGCQTERKQSKSTTQGAGISNMCSRWEWFPTQSPICNRNDGLSYGLAGITFSKWRNESIKAMGNSIVPQVAYQIFKSIDEYEKTHQAIHESL